LVKSKANGGVDVAALSGQPASPVAPGQQLAQPDYLRAAHRHLREIEKTHLIAAIEQTVEAIVITDVAANILYVNPAFTRITGYSSEEVMGKTPNILKSGIHDAAFHENIWRTIRAGEVWSGELINRRKDGSLFAEEATITPLRDAEGTLTGYIAIKQDVTERQAEISCLHCRLFRRRHYRTDARWNHRELEPWSGNALWLSRRGNHWAKHCGAGDP
jgi:PAS domain S-box-containing protein